MFLSITGEDNAAEVLGGSQTRMFDVSPGGGLTLTRLKLSAGTETSEGAVRSDSATLTLDSCVFQGNEATDGDGGAVWADGGNVTIVGGEFTSNNASGYGGAVAATGAGDNLVVQGGSVFEGNTAPIGGALYCRGVEAKSSSTTSCSLSDTIFTSNNATSETNKEPRGYDFSEGVDGGGAVVFLFAGANQFRVWRQLRAAFGWGFAMRKWDTYHGKRVQFRE